jgi:hypothetical protein
MCIKIGGGRRRGLKHYARSMNLIKDESKNARSKLDSCLSIITLSLYKLVYSYVPRFGFI